ncbi:MAG: hypothetical protein H6Q73_2805 [Firmicutes bacterium]|nr:hypothetical protein [Bacillota bacterium]
MGSVMLKRWIAMIVVAIAASALIFHETAALKSSAATDLLSSAMVSTGVDLREVSVRGWCRLAGSKSNEADAIELITSTAQILGKKLDCSKIEKHDNGLMSITKAELKEDQVYIAIFVEQFNRPDTLEPEVYLAVSVEDVTGKATISDWQANVRESLIQAGGNPEINTCLVGWLDGKLEKNNWMKKLSIALGTLRAKETEKLIESDFISVTGYSPFLGEGIKVGDKLVNVNIAVRYSSYDDRTYVIVGSPVIAGEY